MACWEMASDGGSIDTIENSCNFIGGDGEDSTLCKSCVCEQAFSGSGKIASIINSCNSAKHACWNAGANNGNIKSLFGSCNNGENACYNLALTGVIGDIDNGCNGDRACKSAASGDDLRGLIGRIKGINYGCNNEEACYEAGSTINDGLIITSEIRNCCNDPGQCKGADEEIIRVQCPNVAVGSVSRCLLMFHSTTL